MTPRGNPAVAALRTIAIYGLAGGLLIAALRYGEYRFVVIEHSVELYVGLIAALFAAVGIRLGMTLTRTKEIVREVPVVREVQVPVPAAAFTRDETKLAELGITPRELEILERIASGLSTREIAAALFVSENTVKTHASRLFGKLEASRRTQAVEHARRLRLIP